MFVAACSAMACWRSPGRCGCSDEVADRPRVITVRLLVRHLAVALDVRERIVARRPQRVEVAVQLGEPSRLIAAT